MPEIRIPPPQKIKGKCQLCGRHDQELHVLAMWDFTGWICKYCLEEIRKDNAGRFRAASEMTEPAE